jgi:hypothetical protein
MNFAHFRKNDFLGIYNYLSVRRSSPIDSFFSKVELEGNDDIKLLEWLDVKDFSVEHLLELRMLLVKRLVMFDSVQRRAIFIAALSTLLITVGLLFLALGLIAVSLCFMIGGTISLLVFFVLLYVQYRRFGARGNIEYLYFQVEEALNGLTGQQSEVGY